MGTVSSRCVLMVLAATGVVVAQDLETARLRLRLDAGVPARLENRLTGEVLETERDPKLLALLWQNLPVSPSAPEDIVLSTSPSAATASFKGEGGSSCDTVYTAAADGDFTVRQSGRSARAGLYGVQWGIAGIDGAKATVIIPGCSGLAFSKGFAPFSSLGFSWPSGWEAGMLLLQMEKGGFLIWADDPDMRFKRLNLAHRRGLFAVRLQTDNHAPFAESRSTESVLWRIHAYAGDWRTGAEVYRTWMSDRFGLTPIEAQQPGWVKDIRFVVIMGVKQADVLEPLARAAIPERTLLYIPDWRRDGYDVNYPDYTACDEFGPFVETAHRLGFKVMPHVNYFGCDARNPVYARFEEVHLRSPHSDALQYWVPPLVRDEDVDPPQKFAYIHPGSAAWRRLLVDRFGELVETYHVDALHLDQTLCIPNHNRGRVDGLTVPEGNLQLHRDLRQAMPQVALSGEGLDEITLPFEAFAQRHASHAIDHVYGTWDDAFIRCGHPISSYLFLPYNTIYGYLGLTNPNNAGLYNGWKRAYENWGVIPTFSRPGKKQFEQPSVDTALLLEEASLWTGQRLAPDFGGDWSPTVLFRHRGEDGTSVVLERVGSWGSRCVVGRPGGGPRELYRYIKGVNRARTSGVIGDWPAYTEDELIALDPAQAYLVTPGERDPAMPHLSSCPDGVIVTRARQHPDLFALALEDTGMSRYLDFCDLSSEARTGIVFAGEDKALERGAGWQPGQNTCNRIKKPSIHAHPPWHPIPGQPPGALGETFGEFDIALPADRPAELAFAIGLRDGVDGRSDGVTFRISVDGDELFSRHWQESRWEEHTVDLSAYVGKRVAIRFITGPGPDSDVSFDWAIWGDPILRLKADPTPREVEFTLPDPASLVLGSGPGVRMIDSARKGTLWRYRISAPLPATVALVKGTPTVAALPLNLPTAPFRHSATVSGRCVRLPLQYCSFAPGTGTAKGEEREGFAAHPPNNGTTYADFLLELPKAPRVMFRFAVAIQDGATASGVRFAVEANCREVFGLRVADTDGWHPGEVDLTPYVGKPLLLTLSVDSDGPYSWDWARWGDPVIMGAER